MNESTIQIELSLALLGSAAVHGSVTISRDINQLITSDRNYLINDLYACDCVSLVDFFAQIDGENQYD